MADPIKISAYTRDTRIPIRIQSGPKLTGSYYDKGDLGVMMQRPQNVEPADIMDVLKHELVHAALRGISLPDRNEYIKSFPSPQPTSTLGKIGSLFETRHPLGDSTAPPRADNLWKWEDWNRGGDPESELPAYMAIHQPKYTPGTSSQDADGYMQNFIRWLQTHAQMQASKKIDQLRAGRAAYNGTGLFPSTTSVK